MCQIVVKTIKTRAETTYRLEAEAEGDVSDCGKN